jgi:hypothetical protein
MRRVPNRHLTVAAATPVVFLVGGNGRNGRRVSLEDV